MKSNAIKTIEHNSLESLQYKQRRKNGNLSYIAEVSLNRYQRRKIKKLEKQNQVIKLPSAVSRLKGLVND